jgi:hypothetical protein
MEKEIYEYEDIVICKHCRSLKGPKKDKQESNVDMLNLSSVVRKSPPRVRGDEDDKDRRLSASPLETDKKAD